MKRARLTHVEFFVYFWGGGGVLMPNCNSKAQSLRFFLNVERVPSLPDPTMVYSCIILKRFPVWVFNLR